MAITLVRLTYCAAKSAGKPIANHLDVPSRVLSASATCLCKMVDVRFQQLGGHNLNK
jgi:hypothetical protein